MRSIRERLAEVREDSILKSHVISGVLCAGPAERSKNGHEMSLVLVMRSRKETLVEVLSQMIGSHLTITIDEREWEHGPKSSIFIIED